MKRSGTRWTVAYCSLPKASTARRFIAGIVAGLTLWMVLEIVLAVVTVEPWGYRHL